MLLLLIPCFSKQVTPSSFISKLHRRMDFKIFVLLNWIGFYLAVGVPFYFCDEREESCVTITSTLRCCSIVKKIRDFWPFPDCVKPVKWANILGYFTVASGGFHDPFKCPVLYSVFPGTS